MSVKVRYWKDRGWVVVCHYKARRNTKKCTDEAAARAFAEDLEAHLRILGDEGLKLFHKPKRTRFYTFASYAQKWLQEAHQRDLKYSTLQRYISSIKTHLMPYFGPLELSEIDYALAKQFCIEKQPKNSKDGIRLMVAALRLILKEAVRESLIPNNPATQLGQFFGTKSEGRAEKMPFTKAEQQATLITIGERYPHWYEWVLCGFRTGMAFGEQRALKWENIDFDESLIHVRKSWSKGRPITTPKTRARIRKVDMTPALHAALKRMRTRRREEWMRKGSPEIPEWVFLSPEGYSVRATNFLRRVWYPALEEAGVAPRNWHNLRHTFASQLLMAGENPLYVMAQLGHARVSTTFNHYAKWINEGRRARGPRGVDALDDLQERAQGLKFPGW